MEEINKKLFKYIYFCIFSVFVYCNVFVDVVIDGIDVSGKRKYGNDGGFNGELGGYELGSFGK